MLATALFRRRTRNKKREWEERGSERANCCRKSERGEWGDPTKWRRGEGGRQQHHTQREAKATEFRSSDDDSPEKVTFKTKRKREPK